MGIVCIPVLFLQTEADEEDEPIFLKIAGAVVLLLVESDRKNGVSALIEKMGSG